jgi:hypothetical protein
MTMKPTVTTALALAFAVIAPSAALAQETGPLEPKAKFCLAEPVALDVLLSQGDAGATPAPATGTLAGVTEIEIGDIPAGAPADEETAIAIEDLELIYASCYNQGDFLRAAAVLTPRGQAALAEAARNPEIAVRFATPQPFKKDQRIPAVEVRDIQLLEDGLAAAVVLWAPGDPRQEASLHLYTRGEDDLWYLDRAIPVTGMDVSAATPVAG